MLCQIISEFTCDTLLSVDKFHFSNKAVSSILFTQITPSFFLSIFKAIYAKSIIPNSTSMSMFFKTDFTIEIILDICGDNVNGDKAKATKID